MGRLSPASWTLHHRLGRVIFVCHLSLVLRSMGGISLVSAYDWANDCLDPSQAETQPVAFTGGVREKNPWPDLPIVISL